MILNNLPLLQTHAFKTISACMYGYTVILDELRYLCSPLEVPPHATSRDACRTQNSNQSLCAKPFAFDRVSYFHLALYPLLLSSALKVYQTWCFAVMIKSPLFAKCIKRQKSRNKRSSYVRARSSKTKRFSGLIIKSM